MLQDNGYVKPAQYSMYKILRRKMSLISYINAEFLKIFVTFSESIITQPSRVHPSLPGYDYLCNECHTYPCSGIYYSICPICKLLSNNPSLDRHGYICYNCAEGRQKCKCNDDAAAPPPPPPPPVRTNSTLYTKRSFIESFFVSSNSRPLIFLF